MMASRTYNAKRNIVVSVFSKVITFLFPFLTRTVLIYCLGALYLGLNGIFSSVLSVLSLAELGVGTAMVYSMYEPVAKDDTETVCALLNLYKKFYRVIGTVILVLGILMIPFLPLVIKGDMPADVNLYLLYGINLFSTVISYFLFAYKTSVLSATQRMDVVSYLDTGINVVTALLQVAVLIAFRNYYIYCVVSPLVMVVGNIVRSVIVDKMYPQYRCRGKVGTELKQSIKKHVAGLFIYKLCGVLRTSLDSLVISASLGLLLLAKYNNYYFIMHTIAGVLGIITQSITAGIGNSIVTETKEKNYKDFNKFQFLYMWISGFCTVSLFCLYQPFMRLWVGPELMFDFVTMTVFCVYFLVCRWGEICYTYRQGAGLWWHDKIRPVVEAVLNLVISIVLVRWIGVCGVLIGTIIGLVFINAFWGSRTLFRHYFTEFKQRYYLYRLLFFTAVTLLACCLCGGICHFLPVTGRDGLSILFMGLRALVCLVVPNVMFWLLYRLLPEYSDAMAMLKRLFKRS